MTADLQYFPQGQRKLSTARTGELPNELSAKAVPRITNNELKNLPGFFFHPFDCRGLIELTASERRMLLTDRNPACIGRFEEISASEPLDLTSRGLDNQRIPTHRRPETAMPSSDNPIPTDLQEVIYF